MLGIKAMASLNFRFKGVFLFMESSYQGRQRRLSCCFDMKGALSFPEKKEGQNDENENGIGSIRKHGI